MEQPPPPPPGGPNFGQPPTGEPLPYGQPPYAAPPPPRATSPWMYCLGCMGVVAIAAIIGIVLMVNRIQKAIGPPITAATVQQALPPGVPLYPGATVMEDRSRSVELPSQGVARRMTSVTFQTRDDMSVIGPWYEARLKPQGWVGGVSATDPSVYQFKKASTVMSLQARPGENGQNLLSMSVMEGVPPGSVGAPAGP